jgi:hypothetical protein
MMPGMHARAQGVNDDELRQLMLSVALSVAVPLWIEVVRLMSDEQRIEVAAECSAIIALGEKYDEKRGRYGSGPALLACGMPGETAPVFNSTALGLAVMAFAPGGANYLGIHWEARDE